MSSRTRRTGTPLAEKAAGRRLKGQTYDEFISILEFQRVEGSLSSRHGGGFLGEIPALTTHYYVCQ